MDSILVPLVFKHSFFNYLKKIEFSKLNLAVQPNHKVAGGPNPYYKKTNLSNFEYKILDKQVVYSNQSLGAVHPFLYK